MNQVQVEQKSYQMPPQDGFTIAHFLTVADIERSARFYEKVFGGRILSGGDSKGAPGYIQIANTWLIVNVGGGPTPDKPTVTLSVPPDPDAVSSFMNIRVADIHACLYGAFFVKGASRHFCRPLSFHSFVGACMGLVWGFLCQGSITPFLSSFVIPFFCWRFFSAAEGLSLTEASTAAGSPAIGWLAAR